MRNRLTFVLVCTLLFVGLCTVIGSDDSKRVGLTLSVEVVEPVVLGQPFQMRIFATNGSDVPRNIRIKSFDVTLELEQEKNVIRKISDEYWKLARFEQLPVVQPGQRVICFDSLVSPNLRWGTECIFIRGKARISCQVWHTNESTFCSEIVKSKEFEIRLDPVEKKNESFIVEGLQVELMALKQKVESIDDVVLFVKLKNTSHKPIKISGQEKFHDNFCRFLIYGPGERMPISQVITWPISGTGIIIPPGEAIERKFNAAWGVEEIILPFGPHGHAARQKEKTTFLKRGIHSIIVYFHGEDNTPRKDGWTGYARSNVVEVDYTGSETKDIIYYWK